MLRGRRPHPKSEASNRKHALDPAIPFRAPFKDQSRGKRHAFFGGPVLYSFSTRSQSSLMNCCSSLTASDSCPDLTCLAGARTARRRCRFEERLVTGSDGSRLVQHRRCLADVRPAKNQQRCVRAWPSPAVSVKLLNTMIDLCAALIGNCGCQEWLPPVFAWVLSETSLL